ALVVMMMVMCSFVYLFFFFSSRRRHTRFSRDWSSDVCSSDLPRRDAQRDRTSVEGRHLDLGTEGGLGEGDGHGEEQVLALAVERSEERRVGKECRSRGGPYQ